MEPVAANPFCPETCRERESLCMSRHPSVKRRVETGDVSDARESLGGDIDPEERRRLVEWRERYQCVQLVADLRREDCGQFVAEPAVHHTMADGFGPG